MASPQPLHVVVLQQRRRSNEPHLRTLAADGSEWELELAGRGALDELALEIAWVQEHAVALVEP